MIIVKLFSFSLSSHQNIFPHACKTYQTLEYHRLALTIQAYCLGTHAPAGALRLALLRVVVFKTSKLFSPMKWL